MDWIKSDGFSEWDPFSETNTEDSSDMSGYNIPQGEGMNVPSGSNNTSPDNTMAYGMPFSAPETNEWGSAFNTNNHRRVQFEDDDEDGYGFRSPVNSPRPSHTVLNIPTQQPIQYLNQTTAGPSTSTSLAQPFGPFGLSTFAPPGSQASSSISRPA